MYLHYQVMKAYQDELLRTAARDRLAARPGGHAAIGHTTRSPRRRGAWQPCASSFPD